MSRVQRVFGMTRAEWYAQGNPPGSFDDVIRMAEENQRRIYRASRVPHQWDEWDVPATQPTADAAATREANDE